MVAASRSSYFPEHRLNEHHVLMATARAGNVIGGGDWSEDRLIPDLVRGFQAKRPMLIRQPHAIRPWQHVLEPLHGYMLLAEKLLAGNADSASSFNFGPGDEEPWPVKRIADKLAACGVTVPPGKSILFQKCTKPIFCGWIPVRLTQSLDGDRAWGLRKLWNGLWTGTAVGRKAPT